MEVISDVDSDDLSIKINFILNFPAESSGKQVKNVYIYMKNAIVSIEMLRYIGGNIQLHTSHIDASLDKSSSSSSFLYPRLSQIEILD